MNALDQIKMNSNNAQTFKHQEEYKGKLIQWNNPAFVFVKLGATPAQCFLGVEDAKQYIDFATTVYSR